MSKVLAILAMVKVISAYAKLEDDISEKPLAAAYRVVEIF